MDFSCPKCKEKLNICENGVKRCSKGHSFDRAKAGYYNLLLSASGGIHGDNPEMVKARREFLSGGYYQPLADRLAFLVLSHHKKGGVLLDAGCGEGYYTEIVENAVFGRDGESCVLAFDISKDAAKYTAKKCKRSSVAVASSYDMPLPDASVDTVVNVFSPEAIGETLRVLKTGGIFHVVYPDSMHLWELKASIYDTPYENTPVPPDREGLELISHTAVAYKITLEDTASVRSLFMMTPYAYRTGKKERDRLERLDNLTTRVEFCIDTYRKN